jgi:hypothetical protein
VYSSVKLRVILRRELELSYQHKSTNITHFAAANTMLVSLTVGKVDAGVAVLLTEDKRLVCPLIPSMASSNAYT